ncbi:hypothetical protein A2U01_0058891, partial [Trifolium medium]|nr:hypothetical protein [Trifolium medium]
MENISIPSSTKLPLLQASRTAANVIRSGEIPTLINSLKSSMVADTLP